MRKFTYIMYIVFIMLFMSSLLTGCYSYNKRRIKEDLQNYINDLNSITSQKDDALNDYKSIVGDNYTNDDVSLVVLKKLIIPKYTAFLTNLRAINPSTEEVKNLHNIYLASCTKQFDSLNGFKQSLEERDLKKLKKNRNLFKESLNEYKRFQKEAKKLATKYKVKPDIN